ncbi:helix-turn-helix domain-containing protein [Streptomyces sp. NPDC047130]|uniref:PucR family transcriptional regulator n=1 Tax=Streptomyces sp. NPDC047130 TaxID=3155261 RepID=UPI0034058D32
MHNDEPVTAPPENLRRRLPSPAPGGDAPTGSDPEGLDELHLLAQHCLDHIAELVDRYVAEVSAFEGYRTAVEQEDLRETARDSFELLLRLVGRLPVPESLDGVSERLGRRRAQQGVPLEQLLQAVRMDFRVVWTAFLQRTPPERLAELTRGAVRVWEAVEFHTVRTHAAYLDEVAVLARRQERERVALMGRLLFSDGRDQQLVAQAAALLGVGARDRFAVAIAPPASQDAMRRAVASHLGRTVSHLQQHQGMLVLVVRLPGDTPQLPHDWLVSVPCAVGPVARGLAEVPGVVRAAEAVALALPADARGPVTLAEAWMPVAAARVGPVAAMLARSVLSGLDAAPSAERGRLLDTVLAYCDTGSIAGTAARLYCHRNTVLNRLNRFTELTGFDPARPREAATVLFALSCRDTAAAGPADPAAERG